MKSCFAAALSLLMISGMLTSCTSAPERTLSQQSLPYAFLPNGRDPLDPQRYVVSSDRNASVPADAGLIPQLEALRGHALSILELSGGGQNGAFGAGFLKGWREAGTRPQEFDIVTGVSTGALLATHAFLGTPADDATLQEIFTGIDAADIYTKRSVLGLFTGSNAMYDTTPLEALLDRYITAEVLQRVAAAHGQHRRLWVGTTNLDYHQTWVWNMGLIAREGTPEALELYKRVLMASAAPPIAFPPIEIAGYLFVDGGVRQNLLVVGLAGDRKPPPPQFGAGTKYVVRNGKEVKIPHAVRNDARHIAGPVLSMMLDGSTESLLLRSFTAAKARGYRFRLVDIPDDADIGSNSLAFDPEEMQTAFETGYELGLTPDPWLRSPPILDDIPPWALDRPRVEAEE